MLLLTILKLFIYSVCMVWAAKGESKYAYPETKYCSDLAKCEPDKCCKRYGGSLFGGIGRCEQLRVEGQACDLGCKCAPGYTCSVNPLCPKCRPICMRSEIIAALNSYFNKACIGNCRDFRLNHLFKPANCKPKSFKKEGESCNEWCKCMPGTYCAPNVLCNHCDSICMSTDVVSSLMHYFNTGCLNCLEDESPVLFTRANTRFNRISFDANDCVVFPTLF